MLGVAAGQVLGFSFFHLGMEASVLRVAVEQPGQEGFERRISLNFGGGVHDEVAAHLQDKPKDGRTIPTKVHILDVPTHTLTKWGIQCKGQLNYSSYIIKILKSGSVDV